ncbi:MAG: HAMP domain-containing histidine kinase [Candidatus Gastranaerophilales bacterium]|nr:HAMP domain-containing histidine kinase [Candidatus Gastranaerophilales bacterium]
MFLRKKILRKIRKILKTQRERAQKKLICERNKFISILNHDIKTPILAQNQALELLLKNREDEILKEILNSNKFLLQIVLNSIFLQKYELEKPKLKFEKVNVLSEIKNCIEEINLMADEKSQKIVLNMPENVELFGDRRLIQKIIFNILSGSIAFGFENSDIEVSIKENKNKISFQAKNKSIYMTKEKIKGLLKEERANYQDFNQLGMNLNLNVAKKLINAHNWELVLQSQKNNSSIFGFTVKK